MDPAEALERIKAALVPRQELLDDRHETAVRLFNGFYEACPDLVLDLYGRTLVVWNYAEPAEACSTLVGETVSLLRQRFPWLQAGLVKTRAAQDPAARNGVLCFGGSTDRRIREHGVSYAVDLAAGPDAGFYLDTRNLRRWAIDNLGGCSVLNAFAFTGSLGIAARAGGASRVVHVDRKRSCLNAAKSSYALNGFPIRRVDFVAEDFFRFAGRLRRAEGKFDCVLLDPPYFAASPRGTVDQERASSRLINKVRPLVRAGGRLVVVNNALYLSGAEYMRTLEALSVGGGLSVECMIAVPEDVTGWPQTAVRPPPVDPAPFNHPTKIVILRCH